MTIEASDDAHGVFEFSPESLSVNGTEPQDGAGTVLLEVNKFDFTTMAPHLTFLCQNSLKARVNNDVLGL